MNGWTLLDPRWLWALGALALPLILHLISRGTALRVAVGSIRFLTHNESQRARRLRPTQLLLLLLRCLLLAALAVALSGPVRSTHTESGDTPWGLVSSNVWRDHAAGRLDPATSSRLAALEQAGHLIHMTPVPAPGDTAILDATTIPGDDVAHAEDVWSHVREAAMTLPADTRLDVFAYDRMDHLAGLRPTVPLDVNWVVPASNAPGSSPPVSTPSVLGGDDARATARTPLVVVVRHADDRADDARYLQAALEAIAENRAVALSVHAGPAGETEALRGVASDAHVLIWLSDAPPPAGWDAAVAGGTTLLQDGTGPWRDCDVAVLANDQALRDVRLHRCSDEVTTSPPEPSATATEPSATEATDTAAVWRGATGSAVLTLSTPAGRSWRLASRLHPDWSTLVLSPAFPRWLEAWLTDEAARRGWGDNEVSNADARPAGDQRQPARRAALDGAGTVSSAGVAAGSPSPWWWLLVGMLLVVERVVAWKNFR